MKLFNIFPLLIAVSILNGEEESQQAAKPQEIRVQLATELTLSPVYLGKIENTQSAFDEKYLNQLETVLAYDLNLNGKTKLLPRNYQKEDLLNKKDSKQSLNPNTWKSFGAAYVVKPYVHEKLLSLQVFTTETGSLKHFTDIPLTGILSEDRRQIHRVADGIHKALFESEGIASSRILYSVQTPDPRPGKTHSISEIWECDWDGYNARQITHEGSICVTPVALPANPRYPNDRFLYVSYKLGQPKICIASTKDGIGKRVVDLRGNQLLPAISSKRDKMAFISDAGGRTDLFLQAFHPDAPGGEKPFQVFSFPRSTQASPTFSPDGSRLAFVSDKDGGLRIYIIPATPAVKRAVPTLITKENHENSCPAWSPDGSLLAYSSKTKGVRQIWVYDVKNKSERQITFGPGNKENPAWAHDSLHIVFNSTDSDVSELYMINLNQPEAIKITKGSGKKHYPSWVTR